MESPGAFPSKPLASPKRTQCPSDRTTICVCRPQMRRIPCRRTDSQSSKSSGALSLVLASTRTDENAPAASENELRMRKLRRVNDISFSSVSYFSKYIDYGQDESIDTYSHAWDSQAATA